MRPHLLLVRGLGLAAALMAFCVAATTASVEPEIEVQAVFPETNPFSHVVNGERNQIFLAVENKSDRNVTLQTVGGSFHHPETGALIKNITSVSYGLALLEGAKLRIPYAFHSEFKPRDLRLNIWLEHTVGDEKYRVTAYDSIVTIVEPEMSWFDLKLISTYLIVVAMLAGASYFAYLTYLPTPKAKKSKRRQEESASTVTATGANVGGYEEEWIPSHHLKKPKGKKVAASSGDELSTGEASGAEGKKRKARK